MQNVRRRCYPCCTKGQHTQNQSPVLSAGGVKGEPRVNSVHENQMRGPEAGVFFEVSAFMPNKVGKEIFYFPSHLESVKENIF